MSGRRSSPRYPGGPRDPGKPKGYSEDAVLSDEEVQRRVEVLGGGKPQEPPVTQRLRDRRPTASPRQGARGRGRDAVLVLGLVIIGLVAVIVLLPDGPLAAARSSAPPTAPETLGAVGASSGPVSLAPVGTASLITLPPSTVAPADSAEPVATQAPTPPPEPTPTLAPGTTPRPTSKPTPQVTAKPSAPPTIPPTATLLVQVQVANGDGGSAVPGDWLVSVSSSGPVSPAGSFPGTSVGKLLTLKTGTTYSVSATGPSGYLKSIGTQCSTKSGQTVVGGSSLFCLIQLNDKKPSIKVYTLVDNTGGGSLTPDQISVSVTGTNVTPTSSFPGTDAGKTIFVKAFTTYSIVQSDAPADYTASSVTPECAGTGLSLGENVVCTVTFTYSPAPSPGAPAETGTGLLLSPVLFALALRGRRRWTATRTR